ncbi:hypothetical protein [Vibrio crassostreae]|uniref:hypothetical protein n=1 Tax=Vibrio crassostreae TaxID=246167 RepID=UPI001B3099C1|nr:hypothetical protein [Vibrio crassostreae]
MSRFFFGETEVPLHKLIEEVVICRDCKGYARCAPEDVAHFQRINHIPKLDSNLLFGIHGSDHRYMVFKPSAYLRSEWAKTDYYKAHGGLNSIKPYQMRTSEDFGVLQVTYLGGIGLKTLFKLKLSEVNSLKELLKTEEIGATIQIEEGTL